MDAVVDEYHPTVVGRGKAIDMANPDRIWRIMPGAAARAARTVAISKQWRRFAGLEIKYLDFCILRSPYDQTRIPSGPVRPVR